MITNYTLETVAELREAASPGGEPHINGQNLIIDLGTGCVFLQEGDLTYKTSLKQFLSEAMALLGIESEVVGARVSEKEQAAMIVKDLSRFPIMENIPPPPPPKKP